MTGTHDKTGARAGDGKTFAVPFGMALVPRKATPEMIDAGCPAGESVDHYDMATAWEHMIAAAPVVAPLTLETAEEARKDRAHAEAYYRQAERLLTANEATLRAERDQLLEQLAAAQREVIELRAAAPAAPASSIGWTGNADADMALILLDRLDDTGEGNAARISQLEGLVRSLAAALAVAGGWAEAPASVGYSMPNGYAPSRGNRSHTKPSAAGKTTKNRRRAKAAAKSRRAQRAR